MKKLIKTTILVSFTVFVVAFLGCSNNNPSSSNQSINKSSILVLKVSPKIISNTGINSIPVPGGEIDIQTAMVNIKEFIIEEESDIGFGIDIEEAEIIVTGPFARDISSGETLIDSVAVFPGFFKEVEMTFVINNADPFNGKTFVVNGQFTPTNETPIPFILKSEFTKEMETKITGDGINVTSNTTVSIVVTFDLAGWFNNVNFSTAQVSSDGEILIDNSHNNDLLSTFETNLANSAEVEDDD